MNSLPHFHARRETFHELNIIMLAKVVLDTGLWYDWGNCSRAVENDSTYSISISQSKSAVKKIRTRSYFYIVAMHRLMIFFPVNFNIFRHLLNYKKIQHFQHESCPMEAPPPIHKKTVSSTLKIPL